MAPAGTERRDAVCRDWVASQGPNSDAFPETFSEGAAIRVLGSGFSELSRAEPSRAAPEPRSAVCDPTIPGIAGRQGLLACLLRDAGRRLGRTPPGVLHGFVAFWWRYGVTNGGGDVELASERPRSRTLDSRLAGNGGRFTDSRDRAPWPVVVGSFARRARPFDEGVVAHGVKDR